MTKNLEPHLKPGPRSLTALAVLLTFFLSAARAQAQHVRTIGVEEAVKLSLESSKSVRVSQAQIEASRARLKQARDRMIPNLGVSASYYRLGQPSVALGSGLKGLLGGSRGTTNTNTSTAGTTTGATGANAASTSGIAFPKINQATIAQASLSEPLFAGFRTRYAIASEEYLLKAAGFSAQKTKEDVTLNTLSAYYNIYKLAANKRILLQDLQEQARRVKDFTNLEQNGLLTRNDLLKAEVQQSSIQLSLVDVSNELDVALYNLKVMVGLPENVRLQVDTTNIFRQHSLRSREDLLNDALNKRNDLQSQAIQEEYSRIGIKSAQSAYYPSIALNGGYIDAWIPNLLTVKNVLTASVGVQFSLTQLVTNRHKVQEARANLDAARAQFDQLSDNIRMDVNQDYLGYTASLQKIDLTGTTITQAAENYRILSNKYKNSLSTLTDLLDGEVAVLQARINLAAARADSEVAWYKLLNSSGNSVSIK